MRRWPEGGDEREGPFCPDERQTRQSYDEVPPDVLAEPEALLSWVKEAIRAGMGS